MLSHRRFLGIMLLLALAGSPVLAAQNTANETLPALPETATTLPGPAPDAAAPTYTAVPVEPVAATPMEPASATPAQAAPAAPAVGPSFQPAEPVQPVVAAHAELVADDSSLIDVLTATYQNNPKILAERERQESTDEQIAEAVSGFRPTVGATYDHGRQRTAFNNDAWNYNPSGDRELRVQQPLFRGGGTLAEWLSAKQRVKAGAFQLSAVEQQVLLQTITAYADVAENIAILDYARENQDALTKQVDSTHHRFHVGDLTRADVAQAEASLADARAQVANAEGQLLASIATFEHVVGYKPQGRLLTPDILSQLPATLEEALEASKIANPQLLSAVHAMRSADYDVRSNESVLLPQVSLVGTMSRQVGIGLLGSDKFNQDQVGIQVSIPMYQSGSEYAKIREAKAVARQRRDETQDTKLSVEEAVAQAWEQFEAATTGAVQRQAQIDAAGIQVSGMRKEAASGSRTVFDVLEAEQTLFNAQISLAQSQRNRAVAAYNLLFNLGQLTPENLGLPVKSYDPLVHLHHVEWLPAGF